MDLFSLVNPDKLSITCVGYASSCRRRCRNQIAFDNIQAAKAVMRRLVRPGVSNCDLKEMLFNLAEYTLCRRYHPGQATEVSDTWFGLVQRNRDDEEDRFSDTSDDDNDDDDSDDGASDTSSSDTDNDEDDTPAQRADTSTQEELRRRFAELETLQREFDELLQIQRQGLRSRLPATTSSLATQRRQPQADVQHSSKATRRSNDNTLRQRRRQEQEALRAAEQIRQEEAYHAAQQERAAAREQLRSERAEQTRREEARLKREAQLKREAEAKAERLRQEQVEKARLDRERRAKEQEQKRKEEQNSRVLSWESAWIRYEAAWSDINTNTNSTHANANDTSKNDVRNCQIWPTKRGTFESCCEEDVMAFFRCRPGDGGRRMLRRQALRWHPDRAARLFAGMADEMAVGELIKTLTLISQVVIGIMGVVAL
jgi:hypothetical protein